MSCGCNRPGHGPEPHSPVPLHAPLPSHSAIPLKGGSVFSNVIDHLKRQIDRLFKGKADLVDGKVPEDQLPERPAGTVAWDDVEGKPTEFPPSAHGHEDLRQLIGGVSTAVTQLDRRVESAETAAASAVGTAESAQTLARTASLVAGDAELEARNAASDAGTALEKAEAATLSAGNAYTTAMAADSKATDAVSKAADAVSKATDAKSIAEDAQASADDAVGYAELAVRTAESKASASELSDLSDYVDLVEERRDQNERSITRAFAEIATKLDSDGTAENSAKLGGVDASEYARKTDVPSRLKNDDDTERIDGSGNVYGSDTILAYYYCGDDIYAYDEANSNGSDYAFTGPDGQIKYGSGGAVFFNLSVVANTAANLNPLDGKTVLPDFTRNSKTYKFKATSYSISPTPTDRLARESELDDKYALKSDLDAIRYPVVSVTNGQLVDRAVNVLTVSNNQTINAPTKTVKSGITYARDFIVRIEVGSTAPSGYSWGFTPEVKSGDSWDTLGLLEANKKYIYRFTDVGGSSLMVAREEVA